MEENNEVIQHTMPHTMPHTDVTITIKDEHGNDLDLPTILNNPLIDPTAIIHMHFICNLGNGNIQEYDSEAHIDIILNG